MTDPSRPSARIVQALPDLEDLSASSRSRFSLVVANMADGSAIYLPVNVLVGQNPGPRLLMVAGVHGDEYEGVTALLELWDELDPQAISGTVVMVPVANPPAFRVGQRRNPEDMLDMNRVFPGDAFGTVTERLAYRLYHDIASQADMVLSMHGWTRGSLVVPYTEYPRASPVTDASRAAARAFGLGYIEAFDWPPGLLAAVCSQAGIPSIEPEIGGQAISLPERRALYQRGARNLLRHLGMAAGNPEVPALVHEVTRQMLFAPEGGILRQHRELGEQVRAGESIATIRDLNGQLQAHCVSSGDGFVAAQRMAASVNPGDLVVVIFQPQE